MQKQPYLLHYLNLESLTLQLQKNVIFLTSVLQVLYAYGHVYKTFAFFIYVANAIYYYRKKMESVIVA